MQRTKQLLSKVTTRESGHEYKIYTNGEVEGLARECLLLIILIS
jgi:hypothetical protein